MSALELAYERFGEVQASIWLEDILLVMARAKYLNGRHAFIADEDRLALLDAAKEAVISTAESRVGILKHLSAKSDQPFGAKP